MHRLLPDAHDLAGVRLGPGSGVAAGLWQGPSGSLDKNRPLLIDVGTEHCYFCKQLDLRTFKDPAIVALLNERCIPLKIDADQHARLAEALRVEYYPTLVFASAEGKILGYQQGFIEAAALQSR